MKSLHRRFTQRSFHTQKLLHKEVFTQSGFYIQKLLHTKAFTQRSLCTEAPLHEVTSWNWQQFFGKNPCHELFSKNIRNIFLKQVHIQSFQAHTAMKWRVEKSGGADEGRQPLKYSCKGAIGKLLGDYQHGLESTNENLWNCLEHSHEQFAKAMAYQMLAM